MYDCGHFFRKKKNGGMKKMLMYINFENLLAQGFIYAETSTNSLTQLSYIFISFNLSSYILKFWSSALALVPARSFHYSFNELFLQILLKVQSIKENCCNSSLCSSTLHNEPKFLMASFLGALKALNHILFFPNCT